MSLPDPNVYRIHINRRPLLHEVPEHHAPYVMGSLIESGKVFVLNKISITDLLERGQKYVDVGLADGKDWADKVKAEIEHQMVELDYWLGLETDLKNVAHFYSGYRRRVVNGAAEPNPLWPTWIAQLERRMRDGQAGAEEWYAFFKQTTTALVATIRANLRFEDSSVKMSMPEGARTELNTLLKALDAVDEAFDKMAAQLVS